MQLQGQGQALLDAEWELAEVMEDPCVNQLGCMDRP